MASNDPFPKMEEDVSTQATDDDIAKALAALGFQEGNRINIKNFKDPLCIGTGSIETSTFSAEVFVVPVMNRKSETAPTHQMFAKAERTGNHYSINHMWRNIAVNGNVYFRCKPATNDVTSCSSLYYTGGTTFEIVFEWDAKCGKCRQDCSSCAKKGNNAPAAPKGGELRPIRRF
jgi:uncharacterized protein (DUF736 family)